MYVILICTNLQKLYLIPLLYIETNFLENTIYIRVKYDTTVFRREYHMI